MISTGTVSGWENRIILNFYHFKDAITPVHTKKIELDPSFSPDPEDKLLYRFQSTRTNVYNSRYIFSPMLAMKVKHYHLFDNVIFINPALEYHQALQSVLFPLESRLKVKVGFSLKTKVESWEHSLFVAFQNYSIFDGDQDKYNYMHEDTRHISSNFTVSPGNITLAIIEAD